MSNKIYVFLFISFLIHFVVFLNIPAIQLKFNKSEFFIDVSFIENKKALKEPYKSDKFKTSHSVQNVLKKAENTKNENKKVIPKVIPIENKNRAHATDVLDNVMVDKRKNVKDERPAQNKITLKENLLTKLSKEVSLRDKESSLVDAKDHHIDDTNINKPKSEPSQDNFDIEGYSKLVLLKIKEKLEYPFIARRRNLEGDVKILVTVDTDGKLSDIKILESSGFKILDENVIKSAKDINIHKKPPRDIEFPLIISYRLN